MGDGTSAAGDEGNRAKQSQFWGTGETRGGVYRAKQTQFAGAGSGPGWADCAERTQFHRSARAPEGEMRETNPIPRLRIGDSPATARPLCGLPPRARAGRSCETNPIRWGQMCKTNPISVRGMRAKQTQFPGGAGRGAAWGTWDEGCGTNKPNSCHCADPEIGVPGRVNRAKQSQSPVDRISHHSSILSFHHSSPMAIVQNEPNSRRRHVGRGLGDEKRTCETNPIWPSRQAAGSPESENVRNEPNSACPHRRSRLLGAKDAKRTQFPWWSAKTPGAGGAKQSQLHWGTP